MSDRRDKLNDLHEKLIAKLLDRVQSEDCTAQELALAWKILQDNGVQLENLREGLASLKQQPSMLEGYEPPDDGVIAKVG